MKSYLQISIQGGWHHLKYLINVYNSKIDYVQDIEKKALSAVVLIADLEMAFQIKYA